MELNIYGNGKRNLNHPKHYNSAIGSNWAINCNSYYLDQLKLKVV